MRSSGSTTISPKATPKRSCRRITSDSQLATCQKGLIGSVLTVRSSRICSWQPKGCQNFQAFRRKIMSSNIAEIAVEATLTLNPLDFIPDEMPFDVPYGIPVSLEQAQAVIQAAVAEAKKRNWKMNVAVVDSGGNLVAFQRMDCAMLASIQIAEHKARAAATFRRPTKEFEVGVNVMHLNYLLAFDGIIASRGGIPLIEQGMIIGAIGCSGGADSQDEIVSKAGAALINQLPANK